MNRRGGMRRGKTHRAIEPIVRGVQLPNHAQPSASTTSVASSPSLRPPQDAHRPTYAGSAPRRRRRSCRRGGRASARPLAEDRQVSELEIVLNAPPELPAERLRRRQNRRSPSVDRSPTDTARPTDAFWPPRSMRPRRHRELPIERDGVVALAVRDATAPARDRDLDTRRRHSHRDSRFRFSASSLASTRAISLSSPRAGRSSTPDGSERAPRDALPDVSTIGPAVHEQQHKVPTIALRRGVDQRRSNLPRPRLTSNP